MLPVASDDLARRVDKLGPIAGVGFDNCTLRTPMLLCIRPDPDRFPCLQWSQRHDPMSAVVTLLMAHLGFPVCTSDDAVSWVARLQVVGQDRKLGVQLSTHQGNGLAHPGARVRCSPVVQQGQIWIGLLKHLLGNLDRTFCGPICLRESRAACLVLEVVLQCEAMELTTLDLWAVV